MSDGSFNNLFSYISVSSSFDRLSDDDTLSKNQPDTLHYPQLVCVKPPVVEPAMEKPKQKGPKRHPLLITDPAKLLPVMLTPSQLFAELKQSTEERLANTNTMRLPHKMKQLEIDETLNKVFHVSRQEPLFQPFPSEIYFQNFLPMQAYRLPLVLRNNDAVSRHVKVTQLDSSYFRVVSPSSQGDKVGPGLSLTFDVYFMPNQYKDYEHELVFITERESFAVPIYAIGARAFLDFPDCVHFSMCAVKHPAARTLLIRNIGNREANFTLNMEKSEKVQDSFCVSPVLGCLAAGDSLQVDLQCLALQTGNHHGKLIVGYDTGETVQVPLYGAAQDVNIQLSQKWLSMSDTYMCQLSSYSISIVNRSDIITRFRWTQFATREEEDQQKFLHHIELGRDEHREVYSLMDKKKNVSTHNVSVLCRDFHNKRQAVTNRSMLFKDELIRFEPVEGEVWPNSSQDICITFNPTEAVYYTRMAFCDVTGRQSRLPLRIHGHGIGPKLDFSFEELDMGNIFVGSENIYELVVWNKGDIEASFNIEPNFSNFGPAFDFEPADGRILAKEYQAIRISFFSTELGSVYERFAIQINGTAKDKELLFKGSVVAPSFRFSVPKLNFGTVSYGFPCRRTFHLINTSLVPITFRLRINTDGSLPSIHAMGELDPKKKGSTPLRGLPLAKEFDLQPSTGTVAAQSSTEIVATLTSNHVKTFQEVIVVDVEKVGRELQGLPLSARCIIPNITVVTSTVDFGRCCLRYPYQRAVVLKNDSDWPAAYIVPPQERPQENALTVLYHSPRPRGVVEAHSSLEVPIEIQAQELNFQEVICCIAIFGSDEPQLSALLQYSGEGPVVHVDPDRLDWGNIPVLHSMEKTLVMSNQSKITTFYTAEIVHRHRGRSPFSVSPEKGKIPPESSSEIVVTVYLDDCLHFQGNLLLDFVESDTRRVPVDATGVGTTIVSVPPLLPLMDLGPNFCSNTPIVSTFRLVNEGRRHHQIAWSTEGFSWKGILAQRRISQATKNGKKKCKSQFVDLCVPVFAVTPARFNLRPGQSINFTMEACVSEPRSVSETLVCQAILGSSGTKDVIMRVHVSAVFVCPILRFSSKSFLFDVEKKAEDKLQMLEQSLQFSNESSLPLSITMELQYPFSILLPNNKSTYCKELCLLHNEKHELTLCFDPCYKSDLYSRTIKDRLRFSYKEHSYVDTIELRGDVRFPNLEFSKTVVNFGCILNDTEVTRHITMKSTNPLPVKYRWSFFVDPTQSHVKRIIRPKVPALSLAEQQSLGAEDQEELWGKQQSGPEEERPPADHSVKDGGGERNEGAEGWKTPATHVELAALGTDPESPENASCTPLLSFQKCSEDRVSMESRAKAHSAVSQHSLSVEALTSNHVLSALMDKDDQQAHSLGVEEVFDILPLFGLLEPGDSEQVTVTFFGHANVWGEVKAVCEVQGGPNYDLVITGEASLVEYHFEMTELDFGKQLYDTVGVKELTLVNSGRVPFKYYALDIQPVKLDLPKPGHPELVPHSGTIDPFCEQKLQVRFLPGMPGAFSRQFSIQVAHFEPDVIHIYGEGVFPRISLDLPRHIDGDLKYPCLLMEACRNLMPGNSHASLTAFAHNYLQDSNQCVGAPPVSSKDSCPLEFYLQEESAMPTGRQVQMEVEQLAVRHFAQQKMRVTSQSMDTSDTLDQSMDSTSTRSKKSKPQLARYLLDFGYVVPGTQLTQVVRITNTGSCPVSFRMKRAALSQSGFVVGLDKVHQLPGAPLNETVDFVVTFDPKADGVAAGPTEVTVPIDIVHGPMVELVLRAQVMVPGMELSQASLDFQEVRCGQCRMLLFHLYNHQHVPCSWTAISPGSSKPEHVHRFTPLHLRRKLKVEKQTVRAFEVFPVTGILQPGQRANVQARFTPTEQKCYKETLWFKIGQSSEQCALVCQGQGLEPCLEFPQSLLPFGYILPLSEGVTQTLTVHNPCSFPIEFYCLELDSQYLEEEKVLRKIRGYDDLNFLLLPPRNVGEKLPVELVAYYEEQRMQQDEVYSVMDISGPLELICRLEDNRNSEEAGMQKMIEGTDTASVIASPLSQQTDTAQTPVMMEETEQLCGLEVGPECVVRVGQVEISPVLTALAGHLGIDLTTLNRTAPNNCGLAIIVHGAPFSGKSVTSFMMAQHYSVAVVTLDGAITNALVAGGSSAALKARELCQEAGRQRLEDLRIAEDQQAEALAAIASSSIEANQHTKTGSSRAQRDKSTVGSKSVGGTTLHAGQSNCQVAGSSTTPRPAQRLSISSMDSGEEELASCVLPEDLLVDILLERLQCPDCQDGVVFDGLESWFVPSQFSAANAILKALNNRRHIFFCTLKMDYAAFQEQEKDNQEAREKQAVQAEALEHQRLEEMEEDEYGALSQQEKDRIDLARLNIRKHRIKRFQEHRETKEREREEEERRKEEELRHKKVSKKKRDTLRATSEDVICMNEVHQDYERKKNISGKDMTRKLDMLQDNVVLSTSGLSGQLQESSDTVKDAENLLIKRFQTFESGHRELCSLLDLWDRTSLQLRRPPGMLDPAEQEPVKKGKGKEEGHLGVKGMGGRISTVEKADKDRQKQHDKDVTPKRVLSFCDELTEGLGGEAGVEDEGARVPHLQLECSETSAPMWQAILDSGFLPTKEEIVEGMGMGAGGPPLPPPVTLDVVPYPVRRKPCSAPDSTRRFVFVNNQPEEIHPPVEKSEQMEAEEEKPEASKGKGPLRTRIHQPDTAVAVKTKEHKKSSSIRPPPVEKELEPAPTPTLPVKKDTKNHPASRWIVPAQGQCTLKICFSSGDLGHFEKLLRFEIVGTRRQFQVLCRGACDFPIISREPSIVFPSHKKSAAKGGRIVHKRYVYASEKFEFGPLLVSHKHRDKSATNADKSHNCEVLHIHNPTEQPADVSFCFLQDIKGATFHLDCSSTIISPGETWPLTVWAMPMSPGRFEDALVCCIRENPVPVMFSIACDSVRPELVMDKKTFQFDRVVIHRKDTKVIFLRNPTLLPVAWRLVGLENMGDDFMVSADKGVLEPLTDVALYGYFRAVKPVQTSKRMIRLEVSDVDEELGVVQSEPIQVIAEAYDIALDMNFAKGGTCGVDFGIVRVDDEVKEIVTLKNKGKYDLICQFTIESGDPKLASFFSFTPSKVTLNGLDKPTQIVISCKCTQEVTVKDKALFKCCLSEPLQSGKVESVAVIPIRVSIQSVFSRFSILPTADIHFGCLLLNCKKTRTLTINNTGEFDFKFTISKKADNDCNANPLKSQTPSKTNKKTSERPAGLPSKKEFGRQEPPSRLVSSMFTVFPATALVQPQNSTNVNIDCIADRVGQAAEELVITISECDPKAYPKGVPYRLIGEGCNSAINVDDVASIFEEHHVCKSLRQLPSQMAGGGAYGEQEQRFVFSHVLVGRKAKARFKISNICKVPCEVVATLKPSPLKGSAKSPAVPVDAFEVDPQKVSIIGHGFVFVTLTFTPAAIQAYSAVFEAAMDGMARGKALVFEVCGEGTLPRVSVTRPSVENSERQPVLLFNTILVDRSQALPLTLLNTGLLACKVDVNLLDGADDFMLQPVATTSHVGKDSTTDAFYTRGNKVSVILGVGEVASLRAVFRPCAARRCQGCVQVRVVDNPYEDCLVQLVGEGHQDHVTIHAVTRLALPGGEPPLPLALEDDSDAECHLLAFGDCAVGVARALTFSMTNHSPASCVRFAWPQHLLLSFTPQEGHLHAGCTKDVSVTFVTPKPLTLKEEVVRVRVVGVLFDLPTDQVTDWDDRVQVIKWVDVTDSPNSPPTRPLKRKVVGTGSEPVHSEVVESARVLELTVRAVADFCHFSCNTTHLHFKDTLLFQTRVHQFPVENSGAVTLDYRWQVAVDSAPSSDLHSSFTSLGDGVHSWPSSCTKQDSANSPFRVEPEWGTIPPGKTAFFKVKFSPLDVGHYTASLVCSVPNLEENGQGPVVQVQGHSLLPVCHFDLPESDYLSSLHRSPDQPRPKGAAPGAPLDPSTRVLECHALGLKDICFREFTIVNPTNAKYQFEWVCEDRVERQSQVPFHCLCKRGSVDSGHRVKVGFKFVPSQLGLVESFWRFKVASHDISVPFLLVGHTRESSVFFSRPHISFTPLLIGQRETEEVSLVNKEDTALGFRFVDSSCHTHGFDSKLTVQPMSGQIEPNSSVAVKVTFVPTLEKEVTFNLVCKVDRRVSPVKLNVKAEAYAMNCKLHCEDSAGKRRQLTAHCVNHINFGNVRVHETAVRQLWLCNASKVVLDYRCQWGEGPALTQGLLSLHNDCGTVAPGDTQACTLTFRPVDCRPLHSCQLTLKISKGPSYTMTVGGQGVWPGLQLSFFQHDFGYTIIQPPLDNPPTATLTLTNTDSKDISVQCLYQPTPQLGYSFEGCLLGVGKQMSIPFTFKPPEVGPYRERVVFEISGTSQRAVEFSGTGCDLQVELADRRHKLVNLGSCFLGDVVRREIPLVNRSPAPVTFRILISPSCPQLTTVGLLRVSTPQDPVTLPAKGGSVQVGVFFKPKGHIPPFSEQVMLQFGSLCQPLFALSGACLGMDIVVDTDYIPFGTVFLHGQTSRKITMTNCGDINTRFRWDANSFFPDFSIAPIEGYITPGMDVVFDVYFHPQNTSGDIRYEKLQCFVDGGAHHPLSLTLTGSCTDISPAKEVLSFCTVVRGRDSRSVPVTNRSQQLWHLTPVIEGRQWSGPSTFTLDPQQTKGYDLTYQPLTLTTPDSKHQGTVFFAFPDGLGQLHNLVGVAEAPKPSGRVVQDVPCKTDFVQPLAVLNCLNKPQRFQAKIDIVKSDKTDPSLKISGVDFIDVPGNSSKAYTVHMYAYREGSHNLKATFTHEPSGEYQFYELNMRFTRPGVVGVVELSTPVRRPLHHQVHMENPLNCQVSFNVSCTLPDLLLPFTLTLPPLTKGYFGLDYMPLKVGETQGKLELVSNDLGLYTYDVVLQATPAVEEKAVQLRVALGQSQVQTLRFVSYAKQKTEYACKVNSHDILVDKSFNVAPAVSYSGIEVTFDLTFEPSILGEQQSTVTLSSPLGGDYLFPVVASCTAPVPQGPIVVKAGVMPASISFRNVFHSPVIFTIEVEDPLFSVQRSKESVRSKKELKILVSFEGSRKSKGPVSSRLTVSCAAPQNGVPPVQWVYYLKGVTHWLGDQPSCKMSSVSQG